MRNLLVALLLFFMCYNNILGQEVGNDYSVFIKEKLTYAAEIGPWGGHYTSFNYYMPTDEYKTFKDLPSTEKDRIVKNVDNLFTNPKKPNICIAEYSGYHFYRHDCVAINPDEIKDMIRSEVFPEIEKRTDKKVDIVDDKVDEVNTKTDQLQREVDELKRRLLELTEDLTTSNSDILKKLKCAFRKTGKRCR